MRFFTLIAVRLLSEGRAGDEGYRGDYDDASEAQVNLSVPAALPWLNGIRLDVTRMESGTFMGAVHHGEVHHPSCVDMLYRFRYHPRTVSPILRPHTCLVLGISRPSRFKVLYFS